MQPRLLSDKLSGLSELIAFNCVSVVCRRAELSSSLHAQDCVRQNFSSVRSQYTYYVSVMCR